MHKQLSRRIRSPVPDLIFGSESYRVVLGQA
jgi:hypothetical protein